MATMFPDEVGAFGTDGEGRFYHFLKSTAKPDDRNIAWYKPRVEDRKPDFVLYSPDVGLVVLEVKDRALAQIEEANPHRFLVRKGDRLEREPNPPDQAEGYANRLRDMLRQDGRLTSKDPGCKGQPKIPIACSVVFPNIYKREYSSSGIQKAVPERHILFRDDLHPHSLIWQDPTAHRFPEAIDRGSPSTCPTIVLEQTCWACEISASRNEQQTARTPGRGLYEVPT